MVKISDKDWEEARQILWGQRLKKEARELEEAMNETNNDVTMVDKIERTYYLTDDAVDTMICSNELKFVDDVTLEMTSLHTYFRHPSLITVDEIGQSRKTKCLVAILLHWLRSRI